MPKFTFAQFVCAIGCQYITLYQQAQCLHNMQQQSYHYAEYYANAGQLLACCACACCGETCLARLPIQSVSYQFLQLVRLCGARICWIMSVYLICLILATCSAMVNSFTFPGDWNKIRDLMHRRIQKNEVYLLSLFFSLKFVFTHIFLYE